MSHFGKNPYPNSGKGIQIWEEYLESASKYNPQEWFSDFYNKVKVHTWEKVNPT